jgi:S1-C subfamily serine protease
LTKLELANSLIVNREFHRAKAILEEEISKKEKIDLPHFNLLITCLKKMKLADDYFNLHKKFGVELGLNYPNYDNLSLFLKGTEDKIFMIYSKSGSGTGFSITKNKIVTNKHVIEGADKEDLIIKDNKEQIFNVDFIEFDDFEDIVILNLKVNLPFFNIGEFDFVSPGESVLAVGFPRPESTVYSDNIYISKGIVNSIRKTPESHERVVFFDAKIGPGSSGGPLINSLGEVIGITTLYYSEIVVGGQPVALPIHLINKYIN